MRYLINYADKNYKEAQQYCTKMALKRGGFDKIIEFHPEDIPAEVIGLCEEGIYGNNRKAKRYGLWRPYIIKKTLSEIEFGDQLCYCDSGGYFIRNVTPLFNQMEKNKIDIRVSVLPLLERQWTKRDVFKYLNADYDEITDTNQICSTFIFIRKTEAAVRFFDEFYEVSMQAPFLFTDEDNMLGEPNYPEFIENRHNQSVFSVLCKKNGIKPDSDISEYGLHPKLYSYTEGVVYVPVDPLKEFPYYISHRRNKVDNMVHIGNILRIFLPAHLFVFILRTVLFFHKRMKNGKRNKIC